MKLSNLIKRAKDKNNFNDLSAYVRFCGDFLSYTQDNLQATIVSQNETNYQFFQYGKDGRFQITRPLNSDLMYGAKTFSAAATEFLRILKSAKTIQQSDAGARRILNNATYTIQQSIGATLDGMPAGMSNNARKLNGDLFENLIRLIIQEIGISCRAGVVQVPVVIEGEQTFSMSYQHDLIIESEEKIKAIGSVKTSSKDRIDKIFIDKFLYNKLTDTATPHIAVFLNDVQRKKTKKENQFAINSTFLPGHFKGYTVKLNPLDGVYYCDIRPNMQTNPFLNEHIKTFDNLLTTDIWEFL
jgi:ATP-dependent protease ClpP protease subunit